MTLESRDVACVFYNNDVDKTLAMDEKEHPLSPIESVDEWAVDAEHDIDDTLEATVVVNSEDFRDQLALDNTLDATVVDISNTDPVALSAFLVRERTPEVQQPKATTALNKPATLAEFDSDAPEPPVVCSSGDAYFKKSALQRGVQAKLGRRGLGGSARSWLGVSVLCLLSASIAAVTTAAWLKPQALESKLEPVLGPELAQQVRGWLPASDVGAGGSPRSIYDCLAQQQRLVTATARYGQLASATQKLQVLREQQARECDSLQAGLGAVVAAQQSVAADAQRLQLEGLAMLLGEGVSAEQAMQALAESRQLASVSDEQTPATSAPNSLAAPQQASARGPSVASATRQAEAQAETLTPLQSPDAQQAPALAKLTSTEKAATVASSAPLSQSSGQPSQVVKDIQWRLFKQSLYNGSIDGLYSQATDEAVEAFFGQHPELEKPVNDIDKVLRAVDSTYTNRS